MAAPWLQEIIAELAAVTTVTKSKNNDLVTDIKIGTQINSGLQAVVTTVTTVTTKKQPYPHFSFDADKKTHALNQNEEKQAANDALVIPLSVKDEALILAWLESIDEQDQTVIHEVITKCRQCPDAKAFFVGQALKMPQPATITCGTCAYFSRVTYHQRLGHCGKGEPEAVAGLWDTDRRYCEQWQRMDGCVS